LLTAAPVRLQIVAMTDPLTVRAKQIENAARAERLARALRDNLRRRKEQIRARAPVAMPNGARSDETEESGRKPPA
jgi:hypothetical protein